MLLIDLKWPQKWHFCKFQNLKSGWNEIKTSVLTSINLALKKIWPRMTPKILFWSQIAYNIKKYSFLTMNLLFSIHRILWSKMMKIENISKVGLTLIDLKWPQKCYFCDLKNVKSGWNEIKTAALILIDLKIKNIWPQMTPKI